MCYRKDDRAMRPIYSFIHSFINTHKAANNKYKTYECLSCLLTESD